MQGGGPDQEVADGWPYRAAPALHDLDVQDAVAALARNHHAGVGQRQPLPAELADRTRRVFTSDLAALRVAAGRETRTPARVQLAGDLGSHSRYPVEPELALSWAAELAREGQDERTAPIDTV